MLSLLGIVVIVAGFALRANPLLVIVISALVTGWFAGLSPLQVLTAFGKAFNDNRFVSVVFVVLPAIGLMERSGLQQRARMLIARLRGATAPRILLAYLVYRQITSAIGLVSAGGQAQMVRPLIAPMIESAADSRAPLGDALRYRLRALAAATENVGVFFAEDIFIALSPVLLIKAQLEHAGIVAQPLAISLWAIPTAILALIVHGLRIWLFGRATKAPPA